MIAFDPQGPLLTFTAASSAPTSQQATTPDNVMNQQVCLTNTSSSIDVIIGWGASDAQAKLAATAPSGTSNASNCFYLLRGTQAVITTAPNAYFTGISVSSTAVVYVQAGYGN